MTKLKSLSDLQSPTEVQRVTARAASRPAPPVPKRDAAGVTDLVIDDSDPLVDPLINVAHYQTLVGSLPAGFYLAYGGPGSGKSITMVGFALAQNALARSGDPSANCLTRYVALSEPRAPRGEGSRNYELSRNLNSLPNKVAGLFSPVASGPKVGIVIIDSVALAMKSYTGSLGAKSEKRGTMEGGMEVTDQEFCRDMQTASLQAGVLIGVVGTKDIPYVEYLEGLVEGMIEITGAGEFKIRYREPAVAGQFARVDTERRLPASAVTAGAVHLGYVKKSETPISFKSSADPLTAWLR